MSRTCKNFLVSCSPVTFRMPTELCVQFWWINCCTGGRISGQANWVQFYFHEIRQLPSTQCSLLLTRLLFPGWRITSWLPRAVPSGIASLKSWYFHPMISFGTSSFFAASQSSGKIARTVQKALLFLASVVLCPGERVLILWGVLSFFFF